MQRNLFLKYAELREKHLRNSMTETEFKEYCNVLELMLAVNCLPKIKKTYQSQYY